MRCQVAALLCHLVFTSALAAGPTFAGGQDDSRRGPADGAPSRNEQASLKRDDPVYVVAHTAVDCPICKVWRDSDSGLPLARKLSEDRRHVHLVMIDRRSLSGSEDESLYPPELRFLYQDRRDRYQLSPPTPLFEIVVREKVVLRLAGLQAWTERVVPALQQLEQSRDKVPSR